MQMSSNRIQVDFGIWGTVRNLAVAVLSLTILAGLAVWYIPVIRQTTALQREIEIKRQELRKQQELNQKYAEEARLLHIDAETIERTSRQKLGLVKSDETIFRFEEPKKDSR